MGEDMRMGGSVGLSLVFVTLSLFSVESAAKCPTNFLPSDVVPGVSYNYTHGGLADRIAQLQSDLTVMVQTEKPDAYAVAAIHRNTTILTSGSVDTPFRIGSVTKVFAAMGALVLRERAALRLDDPVTKFLPNFSIINPYDNHHQPTLRELASHLSGFPRDLCDNFFICGQASEEEVLKMVANMELAVEPWSPTLPIYSNLAIAVLAHAWEKATSPRQSWSDYLRDHVFIPLGMNNTGADFAQVQLAPGNLYDIYPSNYSLGWYEPAGGMYSTASDLATFLKFMLKPHPELLSASAVREWTHTTTRLPDTGTTSLLPGLSPGFAFAMPWEKFSVTPKGWNVSTPIVTKTGGLGSYATLIAFHPATELGVAAIVSDTKQQQGTLNATIANATTLHFDAIIKILTDLIPEVTSTNTNLIASAYSGFYACARTDPILSRYTPIGLNKTIQVVGGGVAVATSAPDNGLTAAVNLTILVDGVALPLPFSSTLIARKKYIENNSKSRFVSFWASPGLDCFTIVNTLSSTPDAFKPHYRESFDLFEVQFEPLNGTLRWPSIGAVCHKN